MSINYLRYTQGGERTRVKEENGITVQGFRLQKQHLNELHGVVHECGDRHNTCTDGNDGERERTGGEAKKRRRDVVVVERRYL